MKFKTIEDLQSLIDNEIEESTELEYKRSFGINKENNKWKIELAKDVSAMANANGGTIIYGIGEKEVSKGHSIASELIPIPYTEMSKDRLSQLLSSNIQPVIDNIENSGFFVAQIPQSTTAHQNRLNHLYYKRRNAVAEEMEDYEIRDVMNRSKHPVIELEFELHKTIICVTEKPRKQYFNIVGVEQEQDKHYTETKYELMYRLVNKGKIYAKYINFFLYLPLELIPGKEIDPDSVDNKNNCYEIFGDNTTRDITAIKGYSKEYGPVRYDPILPGTYGWRKTIELSFDNMDESNSVQHLWYTLMADNAPEKKVIVELSDIKVIEKTKSFTRDPNDIRINIPSF